ncbi:MAG: DMT family transporter [Planctomycetota bacterium]
MRNAALLCIVLANLIGGATYVAQDLALLGLPPATVSLLRTLIAIVCMGVWLAARGALRWDFTRRETGRLAAAGILGYALPLTLGIVGLRWSTASNGSLLILLEPASILFFSWLLLRERLRALQLAGLLVGLGGALFIVLEKLPVPEGSHALAGLVAGDHLRGNLILALHGVLWGLYSPLMLPIVRKHDALVATFGSLVLSLLLLVPAALAEAGSWQNSAALPQALLWTLALGLVASFGGTILWSWSLGHLASSAVAPFVFLQPLAGVLCGYLVLGERLSADALLGGALIAAGVLLVIAPSLRYRGQSRP